MYEREDLNIVNIGTSARPFAQYTPAVVSPKGDRQPEWWIAHRILQAMKKPSLFDKLDADESPDPWTKWRHMLERGSGLALDDLQADLGPRVLQQPEPGTFYEDQVHTTSGKVDCCPPIFVDAIQRSHRLFEEAATTTGTGQLLLIHRRDAWMHNSWFANVKRMKRGGRSSNPLSMHPDDANALGLEDGSPVHVSSDHGEVEALLEVDSELMRGVVSMVHGWGHAASPRLRVAAGSPGTNPNALLPIGPGSFEPLSSQAHMTGIPVRVTLARTTHDSGELHV
jgi:anaerobic selenocysteine-containing dehydrogenase